MKYEQSEDQNVYRIIGHDICPYVQRVVILMIEKRIAYERVDIDLDEKPVWLSTLSPTGKVPVLIIGSGETIFESSVICDYLDEVTEGSIYPADVETKYLHRSWISYGGGILDLIARVIYKDRSQKDLEATLVEFKSRLMVVERALDENKFFWGERFTLVDAVYSTIFRYFDVFDQITGDDTLSQFPKLRAWKGNLEQRESVQAAVPSGYSEKLKQFIRRRKSHLSMLANRMTTI